MKRHLVPLLVAAGIAAIAASPASASNVYLSGFTYGSATVATLQSTDPTQPISPFAVRAGQYTGTLDGVSFLTFCVEITQYLYFNRLYTDYTRISGVDAWGASKSSMFDHLLSTFITQGVISDAVSSGFAQSAIWEVLYETAPSYGFASGSFTATGSTNPMLQASATDWSAYGNSNVSYHVDLLHSPTAQDLLIITAVPLAIPEPSSVALLFAGAAAVGLLARRRAQRQTIAV